MMAKLCTPVQLLQLGALCLLLWWRPLVSAGQLTELSTPRCGGAAHVAMGVGESLSFSSDYLLGEDGSLPADCVVEWRIELVTDGLVNHGLRVAGSLQLEDSANGASCESSQLMVTDREEDDDKSAITTVECGTKEVSYVTFQDIAIVHLAVSAGGAKGRGFELRVSSVYVCGGELRPNGTTALSTPRAPLPYPPDLFCLWNLQFPAEQTAVLSCPEFSLPRPKGRSRTCSDYLRVQGQGGGRAYCGTQLRGGKKALRLRGGWAVLIFRSAGKQASKPGVMCDVTFEP